MTLEKSVSALSFTSDHSNDNLIKALLRINVELSVDDVLLLSSIFSNLFKSFCGIEFFQLTLNEKLPRIYLFG